MRRFPRFVKLSAGIIVAGLLLVAVGAWQVVRIGDQEELRDCQRAVATRTDGRAMWLYLIDTATEDRKTVETFAAKLDELLPELRCVDGNPVPVPDTSVSTPSEES